MYFIISSNGHAAIRQSIANKADGGHLCMEANTRWEYMGKNKWKITMPASSDYRITDSKGLTPNSWNATVETLRYYNGELYMMPSCQILVRATSENIKEMADRERGRGTLFYFDETSQ